MSIADAIRTPVSSPDGLVVLPPVPAPGVAEAGQVNAALLRSAHAAATPILSSRPHGSFVSGPSSAVHAVNGIITASIATRRDKENTADVYTMPMTAACQRRKPLSDSNLKPASARTHVPSAEPDREVRSAQGIGAALVGNRRAGSAQNLGGDRASPQEVERALAGDPLQSIGRTLFETPAPSEPRDHAQPENSRRRGLFKWLLGSSR